MTSAINPLTAGAVILATAAADAVYVMFTSAVVAKKRFPAASGTCSPRSRSSAIPRTGVYVLFAAVGWWIDDIPAPALSAPRRSSARRRKYLA
jgi:hypothetical protein